MEKGESSWPEHVLRRPGPLTRLAKIAGMTESINHTCTQGPQVNRQCLFRNQARAGYSKYSTGKSKVHHSNFQWTAFRKHKLNLAPNVTSDHVFEAESEPLVFCFGE